MKVLRRGLSHLVGMLADLRLPRPLRRPVHRAFAAYAGADLDEVELPLDEYPSLGAFFVRRLKAGARPLPADPRALASPVDGRVQAVHVASAGLTLQAKGRAYKLADLLGPLGAEADLEGANCLTIYLSPRDYHRIHMPCEGRLLRMVHVPGALYSVNPLTARHVPGLFARNERVVCVFDTPHGPFVNVLVGATIVGSMATVWHGVINPPRPHGIRSWSYRDQQIDLRQSDEMGRFLLGSTVILLVEKSSAAHWPTWESGRPVKLGEAVA